ncbi:uncharacterized protein LOC118438681 [Folsomia candida]|uniref:Uncharacterized protein n=1 Tax=Folsomia candida TaxID=158441 RepID=A0A226DBR9_FOLCA|nr:uncharacterized protein LOC118438681 [Folsomia candida]OXA42995.1 hypothetical protein Fcan01_22371 [Folsomia candida]
MSRKGFWSSTPLPQHETPWAWGSPSSTPSTIYGDNKVTNFVPSSSSSSSECRREQRTLEVTTLKVTPPVSSSFAHVTAPEFKNVNTSRRRGNRPREEPAPVENLFDKYDNDPSFTGGVIKCHEFVQQHFGKTYSRQIVIANEQKRGEIRARFFGDGQPASDRNRVVLAPFSYMTPPRIRQHSPGNPFAFLTPPGSGQNSSPAPSTSSGRSFL